MKNKQLSVVPACSDLTIIIPFLNEGEEIRNTVLSIRSTVTGNPCIMLINDASTDGYDYGRIAEEESCVYIVNRKRKGVAASRDLGIELCTTAYFLLLDGHMRFYEKGWDERLIGLLRQHPESILCGQTRKLEKDSDGNVVSLTHRTCYGAYIKMSEEGQFKADWCYVEPQDAGDDSCVEIACILGAAYAGSKEFWQRLHGLGGLLYYGCDEELLSTKVWCLGGSCLLVKDWVVGHIYRSSFPYEIPSREIYYNRLFVMELFYPYEVKRRLFLNMRKHCGDVFEEAYGLLRKNYPFIKEEKAYWKSVAVRSVDDFVHKNLELEHLCTIGSGCCKGGYKG